ncbi:MAG: replication restart helicase PriA [Fibrobacterota bacterium]
MVISVAFPLALDGLYDYSVPTQFRKKMAPGMPVKVSLRNRTVWGIAVELKQSSPYPRLKEVLDIRDSAWNPSSATLIDLYLWMARYYHTSLGQVFKPLIKKGGMQERAKTVSVYTPTGYRPDSLTRAQADAYERIKDMGKALKKEEIQNYCGLSAYMVARFLSLGILREQKNQILREASENSAAYDTSLHTLTAEQDQAVRKIWDTPPGTAVLLHGITGSGKTLVYQELVKKTVACGQGVIILVPEISLTPQTVQRFTQFLGEPVAVMHSRMSPGERRDNIEQIISGKRSVIIGARSAVLMPLKNPGLIVVDEEHDGSYKQNSPHPKYNARDVAVMRGRLQKARVVLGSATPSMESYYNAQRGKYHLVSLTERFGAARLPAVHIVDMKQQQNDHNDFAPISAVLQHRMEYWLENNRQIILLLNRRGFSTARICSSCGGVHICPHCSVNMVYHRTGDYLLCHHCGYRDSPDSPCRDCGGAEKTFTGTGIQKVEEYIRLHFPQASLIRMDQDSTAGKRGHMDIISAFERKEGDILLGTQMVAKGLNFPGVALVGVLQADIGLSIPDFRSSERLFQLLTQVAGRAGRSDAAGEVYIQTYSPGEQALTYAARQDYTGFFAAEIDERRDLSYPPFSRLARIIIRSDTETQGLQFCREIAAYLKTIPAPAVRILGPVPAGLSKIKNEYRFTFLLKSSHIGQLHDMLVSVQKKQPRLKGCVVSFDIDPNFMG